MCDLVKYGTDEWYLVLDKVESRLQQWYEHRANKGRIEDFLGDTTTYKACDGFFHYTWYGFYFNGEFIDGKKSFTEWMHPGCDEWLRRSAERKIKEEVTVKYREACFDNFIVTKENQIAFAASKTFMSSKFKILVLVGPTGRGKTHLARSIQHELYLDGKMSVFGTADQWHDWFIATQPTKDERDFDAETFIRNSKSKDCQVIFVDDLTEGLSKSQFFNDKFQEILDIMEGKIVITTNLTRAQLCGDSLKHPIFGDRIASRLQENSQWVAVIGPDWRKKKEL